MNSETEVSSVSPSSEGIRRTLPSDEGLTLETSASESRYGSQFTLSNQLIKSNYLKTAKFTMISYCALVRARQPYALCFRRVEVGPIPTPSSPEYLENVRKKVIWGTPRANDKTLLTFITWLCLCQKTGNYRIHEFDWLKSILNAVKIFRSRTVTFCNEVKSCN